MSLSPPKRIICLTEETVEALYLMGAGDRVVGVSSYVERPPEAKQKPTVCSFIKANTDKIVALEPDLVLTFSDLQADITRDLMKRGLNVVGFNQRSLAEILAMIRCLGRLIDLAAEGEALASRLEGNLAAVREGARLLPVSPRVYFEEWDEPLIAGIAWTSELIQACGGTLVFPEHLNCGLAAERTVTPEAVIAGAPDLILASWCGKKVDLDVIRNRPGWGEIPAVANDQIIEINSTIILQPGPACLTDGLEAVAAAIHRAANFKGA